MIEIIHEVWNLNKCSGWLAKSESNGLVICKYFVNVQLLSHCTVYIKIIICIWTSIVYVWVILGKLPHCWFIRHSAIPLSRILFFLRSMQYPWVLRNLKMGVYSLEMNY